MKKCVMVVYLRQETLITDIFSLKQTIASMIWLNFLGGILEKQNDHETES